MAACSQTSSNSSNDEASAAETTETAQAADNSAEAEAADSETIIALEAGDNIVPGELPIVVDFWATWCGPCMRMAPIVDEMAQEFADKAVIGKYNIDEQSELSTECRIMSIPTILFFKNGEQVRELRLAGSQTREKLREHIEKLINL